MEQLIDALVSLLLVLMMPLIWQGIQWLLAKAKLENNAIVRLQVQAAVALAEEFGAKYLKEHGVKLASNVKLAEAVKYVLVKVPKISEAEARQLIESELPKVGLGAAGFLQAVAEAAKS